MVLRSTTGRALTRIETVFGAVAVLVAVVAAWRVAGPTIRPDEWGYLLNGQVLLGRHEPLLPFARYYGPIYGLVTAAGAVLTGSLQGAFRFALVFNVATIVLTAWAVAGMARRWGADARIAALCGLVMLTSPGTFAGAMHSWAEPLVRLWVVLAVWSALVFEERGSRRALVSFVALAGLAPLLHGRLVVLSLCAVGLVVLWRMIGALSLRRMVLAMVSVVLLYATGRSFAFVLRRWLYRNRMTQESRLVGLLVDRSHLTDLLREMAGQGWYLLASTLGLGFVGGVVCAVRARRLATSRREPGDATAVFVLVSAVLFLLLGSLQLVEASRGDQFVYGRYVETCAPVLFVVAVTALAKGWPRVRRWWLVACVLVVAVPIAMTAALRQDIVRQWVDLNGPLRSPNVPALDGMQALVGSAGLVSFALAFGLLGLVAFLLSRAGMVPLLRVTAVVFLVSSSWTAIRTMDARSENWSGLGATYGSIVRSRSTVVGYDDRTPADKRYYVLRYDLHPVRLVWMPVSTPGAVVPRDIACVYGHAEHPPSEGEWTVDGVEPVIDRVLWRRTAAVRC